MPLTLLKRNVLPSSKACDGLGAGLTLLGVQAPEALEAVGAFVSGGEVLPGQLRLTARTHKTLLMPRLVPVGHSSFGQSLFTACAARSELVLVAGDAVVLVFVRDEGLGADGLFAAVADEAALVPCGAAVLQLPRAWHDDLVTGHTFGGELVAVAVVAQQGVVLTGEGLVGQRAVTAETAEAVFVVMSVFIEQLPSVVADQLFALVARVGEETVVARDAVRAVVRLDVLPAIQRFLTVVTVKAVCHCSTYLDFGYV